MNVLTTETIGDHAPPAGHIVTVLAGLGAAATMFAGFIKVFARRRSGECAALLGPQRGCVSAARVLGVGLCGQRVERSSTFG